MSINAIAGAGLTRPGNAIQGLSKGTGGGDGFAASLGRLIEGVEETTGAANTAVTDMLNKNVDVHDAMIALHHAETTLQLTVQIRNKLVQAYQDIMRMPV